MSARRIGRSMLLFDLKLNHLDRQQLAALGEVHTPASPTCSLQCWERSREISLQSGRPATAQL